MATRRFTGDLPPDPQSPLDDNDDVTAPPPAPPAQRPASAPAPARPAAQPSGGAPASAPRGGGHLPRTLTQVMNEANDRVVQGDLVDYVPMSTGFDPLDGFIGGGLRKTELVLLGGAQGIGKTIATLQIARNIAMRPDQYAFYLSYEHTEAHLMHRLLCLESMNPPEIDLANGLKLRDMYQIIVAQRAKKFMGRDSGEGSLQAILRDHPKTAPALGRMLRYSDRLILLKASPAVTNLKSIK